MDTINTTLTPTSLMTFGKHKDTPLKDVPADYLLWVYENKKCSKPVLEYIETHLDQIQREVERQNANKEAWRILAK